MGYRFIRSASGVCNGNFLGIGADDCHTALVVEECASFGLLITNGEFVSFHGPDPTMVELAASNTGSARFTNCAFWGACEQVAKVAGGTLALEGCNFVDWDRGRTGKHAIQATGGSLIVQGCEFLQARPQVSVGDGVKRAVIMGNLIRGAAKFDFTPRPSIQVGLNAADKA